MTKLGGMRHEWLYYTQYKDTPLAEAKKTIRLRAPHPNGNCMQCHSTQTELWGAVPDHRSALEDVRAGRVSCASAGCHGLAHPNFRPRPVPVIAAMSVGQVLGTLALATSTS